MVKQASNVRKRLRRFLTSDPGRFAGGSAVSDPLGLLAVERERLAALRSPQHDGSPQTAATANQGTQPGPSGDVTGPMDCSVDILGGGPAAHYPSEYREFNEIMVPTRRRVYVRNPGRVPVLDSTSIAVDVTDVTFS